MASSPKALTRGQRTQARLLDAAVEVIARRGYHATRVDDIVKAAHTSHGTFYLYFSNKESLFRTLMESVADDFRELATAMPPIAADPESLRRLREWVEAFTDLYGRKAPVVRAWTEIETAGDSAAALGETLIAGFVAALAERITDLHPDATPATTMMTATAVVAMIERCNYYALTQRIRVDRDELLDTLTRVSAAIVVAPQAP